MLHSVTYGLSTTICSSSIGVVAGLCNHQRDGTAAFFRGGVALVEARMRRYLLLSMRGSSHCSLPAIFSPHQHSNTTVGKSTVRTVRYFESDSAVQESGNTSRASSVSPWNLSKFILCKPSSSTSNTAPYCCIVLYNTMIWYRSGCIYYASATNEMMLVTAYFRGYTRRGCLGSAFGLVPCEGVKIHHNLFCSFCKA
jgi:hypothetical protein